MFGYILPEKPELKMKEYDLFKAYYCGVCKSMGNRLGLASRFTLNYDSAFLAILLSSLSGEKLQVHNERCIAHPAAKRLVVKSSAMVDYASDMNVLLAYYKLKDNWQDDKSWTAVGIMAALHSAFQKIQKKYPEKSGILRSRLQELSILEKEKCDSMDKAAEPFAKIMEEITACELLPDFCKHERILRWIGYNIGRWIYIMDAYDDMERDYKKKSYNPLLLQFHYKGEEWVAFRARIRERVEFNLVSCLGEISKGYQLLQASSNQGLLENIIYMGMLRKTENILGTGSCSKDEKSV